MNVQPRPTEAPWWSPEYATSYEDLAAKLRDAGESYSSILGKLRYRKRIEQDSGSKTTPQDTELRAIAAAEARRSPWDIDFELEQSGKLRGYPKRGSVRNARLALGAIGVEVKTSPQSKHQILVRVRDVASVRSICLRDDVEFLSGDDGWLPLSPYSECLLSSLAIECLSREWGYYQPTARALKHALEEMARENWKNEPPESPNSGDGMNAPEPRAEGEVKS